MATSKVESSGSNQANNATNGENSGKVGTSSESHPVSPPVAAVSFVKSYASVVLRMKNENGTNIPNTEVGPNNKSQKENTLPRSASVAVGTDPKITTGASMDQSTMNVKKRDEQEKVQKASRVRSNVNNSKGYNGNANGRESHNYRSHNNRYEGSSNSRQYNEHRNSRYPTEKHENYHNHTNQKMTNSRNYSSKEDHNQQDNHVHSQEDELHEHEQNDSADEGAFQKVVRKKSRNVGNIDSGKDKEFITNNNRNGRSRSFRDRRKVHQEGRDNRRQPGERDRDKHHTVPLHHQPPTSQSPINNSNRSSNAIINGNASSSYVNGLSVVSGKAIVVNGSVCSESGSSSLETVESITNNSAVNSSGSLDGTEVDLHPNNSHGMVLARNRHLSGGSVSGSASTCETENNLHPDIAQSLEEESDKLQFVVAPPPAVNPWQIHPNAASVISKKLPNPQAVTHPPIIKTTGTTIPPTSVASRTLQITFQKKPVAALNGELKGTEKEKTNNTKAINSKNISTVTPTSNTNQQLTNNSAKLSTQSVEQSSAPNVKTVQSTPPKSADPQLSQPSQRNKDIKLPQEQGPKTPRRAFAAVTKSQKFGFGRDQESRTRTSQEDWPTLQEALATPITISTPSVAHSKSVIAMALEPGKLTRSNTTSGTESTATDSGDEMTLIDQIRPKKLPSDKWPSIANSAETTTTTEDAKNSQENNNNVLHSNLEEVASSCILTDDTDLVTTERKYNGDGHMINENGSTSSSDDSNDIVENELDPEAVSGQNRKIKKSKKKWRPVDWEAPSSKSRGRRDRISIEREREQRDKDNNNKDASNHKLKAKILSHKEDGPVNVEGKSNNNYVGRGRGRANVGRGGRGGRGRINNGSHHHQHQWNYHDVADPAVDNGHTEDYTDYPRGYTTLHPMYPITELEFVMPYICSGSPPPGVGVLIDTTKINPVYVTSNEHEVLCFLQNQIEYYFSEPNLQKDEYMKTIMDEQGFIPVEKIAMFNRVSLHAKGRVDQVIQAIQASPHLELSEDLTCVRTIYEPTKWPKPGQALGLPPVRVASMLQSQIENYFTQENLEKDEFMKAKMDEQGYFPVDLIANFNRVRMYAEDLDKVVQAIKASPLLELSEDLTRVRTTYEPTQWPTQSILPARIVAHSPQPEPFAASGMISNGIESLSDRSSPSIQTQIPSVSDKLRMNPDAPQFVPKSQIPEIGV